MFDTLSIITLFLLASLLVGLLTLRLSINIKHLCLCFHSLPILTDFLKFHSSSLPPVYFDPRLLNLTKISETTEEIFSEEILNGKLHFCAVIPKMSMMVLRMQSFI